MPEINGGSFRTEELLVSEELCSFEESDPTQEAFNDSQTEPPFHPVSAVIAALAPAIIPPQTGNPPFNSRSPPVATPTGWRAFPRTTLVRRLAHSWDRHRFNARSPELLLRVSGVDPTIGGHQPRRSSKHHPMMRDRIDGLAVLFGVFQDLLARDQSSLHLIHGHQPSKLDERAACMPRNGTGVWLKQTEHLVDFRGPSCSPGRACGFGR